MAPKLSTTIMIAILVLASRGAPATGLRPEGTSPELKAIVCVKAHATEPEVYFAGFADLDGNGRVHRRIIEKLGSTPDEQIREHTLELSEADRYVSDLFDGAMEHVKRTSEFVPKNTFPKVVNSSGDQIPFSKTECEFKSLVEFSPAKGTFVVNQDLYSKLNATDRAGLWSDLAFTYLAHQQGSVVNSQLEEKTAVLVKQLFYGNEEDRDRVKVLKVEPTTKTERLDKIRELIKPVLPDTQVSENGDES